MAPLHQVRWNASADRTLEDFLALGAIGEDDERKGENEQIREFERIRESGSEEKKKGRDVFVERKRERIYEEYER